MRSTESRLLGGYRVDLCVFSASISRARMKVIRQTRASARSKRSSHQKKKLEKRNVRERNKKEKAGRLLFASAIPDATNQMFNCSQNNRNIIPLDSTSSGVSFYLAVSPNIVSVSIHGLYTSLILPGIYFRIVNY